MIKTSRLWLIPSLSMFLLLVPIIGIPLTFFVLALWWIKYHLQVISWIKGDIYYQNEMREDFREEMK